MAKAKQAKQIKPSANLRTNGNREQFALTQDATVHNWHAAFIEAEVGKHEGEDA